MFALFVKTIITFQRLCLLTLSKQVQSQFRLAGPTSFELEGILKKAEPKALFFDREFRDIIAAVNVSLEDCLMVESGVNAKTTQLFEDILHQMMEVTLLKRYQKRI
ncbi:hypothetical protein ACEQPO_01320 [Bacillus sp. SL00103]